MKELVEYIVKQIVNKPEAVVVEETTTGTMVDLKLTVDPEDMGIVIGKAGQTIKSIRKILIIKAISDGVKVDLELVEPAGSNRPRQEEASDQNQELSQKEEDDSQPTDSTDSADSTDKSDNTDDAGETNN